jgi:hypothetical protein
MELLDKVLSPPPESSSRLDARVSLLTQTEGFGKEAVAEAIGLSVPELCGWEKHNWQRYAGRTANYAFGMALDMELVRMPHMEQRPVEPSPPKPPEGQPQREAPQLWMRGTFELN